MRESQTKAGGRHSFYDRLLSAYSEEDLSSVIANARVLLVVAGGYDTNVTENIQYLKVIIINNIVYYLR